MWNLFQSRESHKGVWRKFQVSQQNAGQPAISTEAAARDSNCFPFTKVGQQGWGGYRETTVPVRSLLPEVCVT